MSRRTAGWVGAVVMMMAGGVGVAQENGVVGNWRTPGGSVVRVYGCGEAVCLKLLMIEKGAPTRVDAHNPNASLRGRSLCGLEIGQGFRMESGQERAEGGELYDPESGRTYKGSLELAGPERLKLRGYVGLKIFGRTETWNRVPGPVEPCH